MPKKYTGPNRRIKERRKDKETLTTFSDSVEWSIGTQSGVQRRDSTKNRRKKNKLKEQR